MQLIAPRPSRCALSWICCFLASLFFFPPVSSAAAGQRRLFALLPVGEFARSLFLGEAVKQTGRAKRVLAHYSSCSLQRKRVEGRRRRRKKRD